MPNPFPSEVARKKKARREEACRPDGAKMYQWSDLFRAARFFGLSTRDGYRKWARFFKMQGRWVRNDGRSAFALYRELLRDL